MTRRIWTLIAALALLATAIVAGGCGDDEEDGGDGGTEPTTEAQSFDAGTTMAELQEAGEITIGVKYDVPPFGFKNPQTGDVEGFDVDLGKEIAAALGVEPKFVEAISDNRIPFLVDGTVDLILSTMTITEERDLEIDFSEPYYIAHGRVLTTQDSDVAGLEDLGDSAVCTALGSTYAETIEQEAPDAELRLVDSYSECLELIQNGAVEAVSTDDVILTGMIAQDDTLQLVGEPFTTEPYGVGIPEGDTEMKEFVDGVLADVKESGRWQEIYDQWVGVHLPPEEHQEPPAMSLDEALKLFPLE